MEKTLTKLHFSPKNENHILFTFLVKTEEDQVQFLHFLNETRRGREILAISRFRYHKRQTDPISLHTFLSAYDLDKQQALEQLFKHPVNEKTVELLQERLNKGRALTDFFMLSEENPKLSPFRVVQMF